jgi:uncharacterized membrane protein YcaP (DUF421 family)
MGRRELRKICLVTAFLCLGSGAGAVALFASDRLWLLVIPVFLWGTLFMVWAFLNIKAPYYYG